MTILKSLFSAVSQFFGIQKKKSSRKSKPQKRKSKKSSPKRPAIKKKKPISSSTKVRARSSSKKKSNTQRPSKKVHKPVPPHQKSVLKDEKKGVLIGPVTHYFDKIRVCVVNCSHGPIKRGDRIRISGKATLFRQTVDSLQVESRDVVMASKGQLVGLKVKRPAKPGDMVFRE
jgi:hypothetical protein